MGPSLQLEVVFLFVPAPQMWKCGHHEKNNLPEVIQVVDRVEFESSLCEGKALFWAAVQRCNVISGCNSYLGSGKAKTLTY